MKESLTRLFDKSIELGDEEYTENQIKTKWLGNPPADKTEIKNAEKRLGIKLPQDYIELITIANGFPTSSNSIEPSFQKIQEIDFFRNFQWNCIDSYKKTAELKDVSRELEKAIMIAGLEEEQQFLIIPPEIGEYKWKYWKSANWIPGEEEYSDLKSYLEIVIDFLSKQIQENKK